MSTVNDVTSISIDQGPSLGLGVSGVDTVTVVEVASSVDTVTIEVPGIQGPPGVQNVYVQPNDPAIEYGWGPEEAGYIWIEVDV